MLLTIDAGNTAIKFGTYRRDKLIERFTISSRSENLISELSDVFNRLKHGSPSVDAGIVCSVVPATTEMIKHSFSTILGRELVIVDHGFDFGIENAYQPATSVGIDRLVNCSAAVASYGAPIIVCSLGTATTIDYVDGERKFVGGTISPGLRLQASALRNETAQLPFVEIEVPEKTIANTTLGAIQAGIFFGYIGAIEKIVANMCAEVGEAVRVLATGGFARLVARRTFAIDIVDENLTLNSLNSLHRSRA